MEPVICTYQGSFSPPTIGHEDAARIIATKLIEIYPRAEITLLFMPTANIGSKESISIKKASETPSDEQMEMFSDYVSEKERIALLTIICVKLNSEFKGAVKFIASDIEIKLAPEKKSTATIHTLRKLREIYDTSLFVLAMGEDNGRELPWWQEILEYPRYIDKLLFVDREPPVEASIVDATLPYFETYNPDKKYMRFDKPSWSPKTYDTLDKDVLLALAAKTHLLRSPVGVSSTMLRAAIRAKDIDTAKHIAGVGFDFIIGRKLLIRTKREVKDNLDAVEDVKKGGARRTRKRQKRSRQIKRTKNRARNYLRNRNK